MESKESAEDNVNGNGQSPEERKRLKRRRNKEKFKARLQEVKEKSIITFHEIVKDIYSLRTTYQKVENILEKCFSLEEDNQVLYDSIDSIMKTEIDAIRKRIMTELSNLPQQPNEAARNKTASKVFEYINRIQQGSPEIEKIINLFVRMRFGAQEEDPPIQTNLDLMTLKFLYHNDLLPQNNFSEIVARISQGEEFEKERQIYSALVTAVTKLENGQEQDWSGYESEEEEGTPNQTIKPAYDQEDYQEDQDEQEEGQTIRQKAKRKNKKKKDKYDLDTTFESILQRTQELEIKEEERQQCKVEEGWLERMRKLRRLYCHTATSYP